ncbi:MAG: TonB-dependent receptor [Saprospiraceae bacterium]|nr:TonB-dependent receptor [Saprospiraceae bacterium]
MRQISLLCLLILVGAWANAQITTSSISGKVTDSSGQPLFGSTVAATHTPSGTFYGATTLENGRYTLPNLRVGGPYTVEVSYIGYTSAKTENIFLELGKREIVDFSLNDESLKLDEVVIMAKSGDVISKDKTGASTSISRDQIANLPTISRSTADYTRLNPMSAEGGSFGGRNDQFNNYSVNGTIFNNPFGLDAATPGGQTDAQPISLDAIDQIQVSIAPYDITQSGFTGASVNAVTKSGTNNFEGTVYGFFRNSSMIGSKVRDTEVNRGDVNNSQYGFAIGGPIIKDKVFFFVNLEIEKRADLGSYFLPAAGGVGGSNVSRVLESDMIFVSNMLNSKFGYDTGAIKDFKHNADNNKGLVRMDFNLHKDHKLSASYNFLDAFKDKPAHPSAIGPRGPSLQTLQFQNSGYRINNKIHSGIIELKSVFGSKYANKFQAGYTAFKDSRDPFSSPFPVLNILKDGSRYIIAGHEPFSIHNVLNQNVLQLQDNFNIYLNNHTLTIGASFEKFSFENSFNLTGYGFDVFGGYELSQLDSITSTPAYINSVANAKTTFDNNNNNDTWALAETNIGQISGYIQDEITVNDKLTLTAGVRIDVPQYFDTKTKIEENIARNGGLVPAGVYAPDVTYYDETGTALKFDHTVLPKQTPLINPRLGINYRMNESLQLRGGSGLFTGRLPFVWVGNQVANPAFFFYCTTAPDFKLPQIWRTNVGIDKKLDSGWSTTLDILYTKDINAQMTRNYGLIKPTGTLEGADNRPIYLAGDRAQGPFGGATNAYVFTNTDLGYSFNAALQVQKTWETMSFMFGYNYLDAKDAASIDAEISSDAYERNPANVVNTNVAELTPSLYGNKHRVIGAFSKKFTYASDRLATTISLFTEYAQGGRFSFTYSGDINNDGSGLNDLIYIPSDAEIDGMNFSGSTATAQRAAFKSYIAQDDYLSSRRGEYAEKYASLSPWYNHWDLRVLQDIKVSTGNKFQISVDILNVGNLVSSSWGVRQYATYTGLVQPVAVSVNNGAPVYTFDQSQQATFFDDFNLTSRWQMQIGLRYIFK